MNAFQDNDNLYMVMPMAHGGVLLDIIKNKRGEAEAAGRTETACSASETQVELVKLGRRTAWLVC